jgi:hypothetical protein
VETEAELIELLMTRLRTGREVFGMPVVADQDAPSGMMRGKAQMQQLDLLGEDAVEFTLQGQTDRTSLTPEEMQLRAMEAERIVCPLVACGRDTAFDEAQRALSLGGLELAHRLHLPLQLVGLLLVVAAEQAVLVAVHPWDIHGARQAGMHAVWVNRSGGGYPSYFSWPSAEITSLMSLAETIKGL